MFKWPLSYSPEADNGLDPIFQWARLSIVTCFRLFQQPAMMFPPRVGDAIASVRPYHGFALQRYAVEF
jgi:hypothetical protein